VDGRFSASSSFGEPSRAGIEGADVGVYRKQVCPRSSFESVTASNEPPSSSRTLKMLELKIVVQNQLTFANNRAFKSDTSVNLLITNSTANLILLVRRNGIWKAGGRYVNFES
jgi:hypothetical protein